MSDEMYFTHSDIFDCKICNKQIPLIYYDEYNDSCNVCYIIQQDEDRECRICKLMKKPSVFERPYLTKCRKCAAERARRKIPCNNCGKLISYGSMSKHIKICNDDFIRL